MLVCHFFLKRLALRGALALACSLFVSTAQAATFHGEFFDINTRSMSIAQARAAIDGVSPTATFESTAIDYPNNTQNSGSSNQTLSQFLGVDAASIVGNGNATITTSVFRFTGFIDLVPGAHTFAVGSDDGFQLVLNNQVVSTRSAPRGFRFTTTTSNPGSGRMPVELIYYENFGRTGVEFFIDGVLATPAVISLPGTASLSALGLGALVVMSRRRKLRQKTLAPAA